MNAAQCAIGSGAVGQPPTLTIIDYSKPSTEPRLWVLDLRTRQIVYEELVAHGQGSGGNLPDKFSNEPDSHQTSIGLFVTEGTYVGRNGYSLRLNGLERGFNDRAKERAIVMHGAPYVNARSASRWAGSGAAMAVRPYVNRSRASSSITSRAGASCSPTIPIPTGWRPRRFSTRASKRTVKPISPSDSIR